MGIVAEKMPNLRPSAGDIEKQTLAGCLQDSNLEIAIMSLMILEPCINLSFDGQCEAAFKFYERCLNGKITFMLTWGNSPAAGDVPTEWRIKVAHATLVVGSTRLQGSDPPPGSYQSPRGFGIALNPNESDAERLFAGLAEGGTIRMPLQETFWAARVGELTDRFGVPWIINCHKSE
jgi:PhnB protein